MFPCTLTAQSYHHEDSLSAGLRRFSFHRGLMGTQFNLTFYAADSLTASRANAAVSARMDTLNQIMSDYLDGSEINRLSATSGSYRWVPVSADLFEVLQKRRQSPVGRMGDLIRQLGRYRYSGVGPFGEKSFRARPNDDGQGKPWVTD